MKTTIIKYNAGNTKSVANALLRLGIKPVISADVETIKTSDYVIFPGVGEAYTAMNSLKQNNLDKLIKSLTQPVLGICIGMQLLCSHTEENDTEGIGVFNVKVKKFPSLHSGRRIKVPHVGWNQAVRSDAEMPEWYYFVHSYYAEHCEHTYLSAEYGIKFSAALRKDNFFAVQFHAEKSAQAGEAIIKRFIEGKL